MCYKKWNHLLMKGSIHLFYNSLWQEQPTLIFLHLIFLLALFPSSLSLPHISPPSAFITSVFMCVYSLASHRFLHLLPPHLLINLGADFPYIKAIGSLSTFFSKALEVFIAYLSVVSFLWRRRYRTKQEDLIQQRRWQKKETSVDRKSRNSLSQR